MDMLIKEDSNLVKLKLRRYYTKGDRYFEFDNQTYTINLNLKDRNLSTELFSFNEYDRVTIEFLSNSIDDRLEIECYYDKAEVNAYKDEFMKELKPGDTILLSPGGDLEDMLVPGTYEIKINKNNIYYSGVYSINPSTATWSTLINMRQYVEEKVKGLSQNIYLERKGRAEFSYNVNDTIMEKYRYINETNNILISSLDSICKDPITSVEKIYKHCNQSKKITNKSQRWMNKKGHQHNEDIHRPEVFYEKRSIVSKDTYENRILKNMLEEIHTILVNILVEYSLLQNQIKEKINSIDIKISELERRRDTAKKSSIISKRVIDGIESDLYGCRESKKPELDKYNLIQGYRTNVDKIKSNLNFYLRESWISELEESKNHIPTTRLVKNKYYNEIYRINEYLKGANIDGKERKSFPYKKTSKLYEVYNVLLIKEILEEIGFQWTSGWLKDESDILSFNGDLKSGDYIVLEYKNYKVKIIYDKLIERSKELTAKSNEESQISAKQYLRNRRPDILIEFYEDSEFLKAIIVEVKYRKIKYIHSDIENTEVDEQLESYKSFEYYDGKSKRVRWMPPIAKVIAVYPQQENASKIVHNIYPDIMFLPIMPSENKNSNPEGYEELRNEIIEIIEEHTGEEILVSTTI